MPRVTRTQNSKERSDYVIGHVWNLDVGSHVSAAVARCVWTMQRQLMRLNKNRVSSVRLDRVARVVDERREGRDSDERLGIIVGDENQFRVSMIRISPLATTPTGSRHKASLVMTDDRRWPGTRAVPFSHVAHLTQISHKRLSYVISLRFILRFPTSDFRYPSSLPTQSTQSIVSPVGIIIINQYHRLDQSVLNVTADTLPSALSTHVTDYSRLLCTVNPSLRLRLARLTSSVDLSTQN